MNKRVNPKQTPNTENVAMPTTGSASSPNMVGSEPGAEGGAGGAESRPSGTGKGSMKIKRTSSSKVLTKSKSSGSLKKKAEPKPSGKNTELTGESASGEMEMLTQKQNGTVGGAEESEEQEQEEKKEHTATIKGLWKKAFKSLKSGGDQKWSVKKGGSLKRRDSKEAEEAEPQDPKDIDPVYSLLKCAADLPKVSRATKEGQPASQNQGAPCSGLLGRHGDSSGSTSKASSPSSSGLPLTPDGSCPRCGAMHHTEVAAQTPGHDFKQFYKQTSPVKRQTSADLGI